MERFCNLKNYLLFFSVCFLTGSCDPPPPVVVDLGPVPPGIKARVPYSDGEMIRMEHSRGAVIDFHVHRESRMEETRCEEWCDKIYRYEVDETRLEPDYLLFTPVFRMTSQDTITYTFEISMGSSFFILPLDPGIADQVDFADSVEVGGQTYYEVFRLKAYTYGYPELDSVRVDSLYYNTDRGMLKILMSNDEFFQIHP